MLPIPYLNSQFAASIKLYFKAYSLRTDKRIQTHILSELIASS